MRIKFKTPRLSVGPMTIDHTAFMFELLNSNGWIANIGDRNIQSMQDAAAYIEKINANPNYAYLVSHLEPGGAPIGLVTLIKRDYLEDHDIGFAVLPQHQQRGYSYEAIKAYLDRIAQAGVCKKVVAITVPHNTGSIKLIEKLGLAYEKEMLENEVKLLVYGKFL